MQDRHARDFTISPEASRHSHVQLRWHYVRKIVKAQSSLMTVDPLGSLYPIPGTANSISSFHSNVNGPVLMPA
jgi:hypothetical protein